MRGRGEFWCDFARVIAAGDITAAVWGVMEVREWEGGEEPGRRLEIMAPCPYTTLAVMAGNNHRGQPGQSGEREVVPSIKGGLTVKAIMSGSFLVVT